MPTKIRIPSPLRSFTNGADAVDVDGANVGAALNALTQRADGIATRLFKSPGQLNRFVNIYLNDEDIRFLQNLETPLKTGDEISIVPAIAGGWTIRYFNQFGHNNCMSVRQIHEQIIEHIKAERYRPQRPRGLAKQLSLNGDDSYHDFRNALKELLSEGQIALGPKGAIVLPMQKTKNPKIAKPSSISTNTSAITGTYRHNKRGFGFVIPTEPPGHEDLFIPEGANAGAITGDIVQARITSRSQREGKVMYTGRVTEVVKRSTSRFVGSLVKQHGEWIVMPDGNSFTSVIRTPDAAARHIKPGTKVVVELTSYPDSETGAQGVITEILGASGEKDVDLRSVIVQFNLPEDFPDEVKDEARRAVDSFDPKREVKTRLDLTNEVICTIDPDDAKDYDDAISLKQVEGGYWELGVHIADVSYFVKEDSALDIEARERGNSAYFPGFVIPMLPEILSNGVCSLQEAVPRLCKSAFITLDDDARPIRTRFANTIIKSDRRLRYTEAQAIIDGASSIPHPDGAKRSSDYPREVVALLMQMNDLAKRIQQRRLHDGQLVLSLPEIELVLDDEGKVVDAKEEDTSFTHTLIEMFMVEANEAVARLLDSLNVPFLRRIHPTPDMEDSDKLRHFAYIAGGHKLPKDMDRKALQVLLAHVKDRPEAFAINLAVLKSLTRAEYSPETVGHYALASEHYGHFTSPIRRYADLTIHRLLDAYFAATGNTFSGDAKHRPTGGRKSKVVLDDIPSHQSLIELGKHISFTERRAEDAERELRRVKILTLLQSHIGDEFKGIITGITNFGIFIQLEMWLVDGLIRYEDLMDDWWDVDERGGVVRGKRTGTRIGIGDVVKVVIAKVDLARRELDLAIKSFVTKSGHPPLETQSKQKQGKRGKHLETRKKGQNRHPRDHQKKDRRPHRR